VGAQLLEGLREDRPDPSDLPEIVLPNLLAVTGLGLYAMGIFFRSIMSALT
jgi:hypothetical protein